jgi:hypothetical protein
MAMSASATVITVTPYLSEADIPTSFYLGGSPIFLEDFEDRSLDGGITVNGSPTFLNPGGLTDSVDGDDGTIDGSGTAGRSLFRSSGATGFLFTFSSVVTAAGLVWTDGAGSTTFSVFDGMGVLIETLTVNIAGSGFAGQTAEDTFFGLTSATGIGSIFISNTSGGIEVDHVQYGDMYVPDPSVIPLPAAGLLLLGGLAGLGAMRRLRKPVA